MIFGPAQIPDSTRDSVQQLTYDDPGPHDRCPGRGSLPWACLPRAAVYGRRNALASAEAQKPGASRLTFPPSSLVYT